MYAQTVETRPGLDSHHVRTVLVVDDEAPIRIFLTEYLSEAGLNVVEAANVAEAIALLRDQPVDLVFSDINMPGGETGFGLADWVRRHRPNTKVLLTSGYPQLMSDMQDLAEPLIMKPYNLRTVLRRIERLFAEESVRETMPMPL
jgi:DNA-binding NtrC family response regulator